MKKSIGPQTIAYPAPVFIVGAYDAEGKPNIMNAAWGGICCSKPPCVAVSLREATYTFGCIKASEAFTVNIPSQDHVREADYVGMHSGRDEDKFAATGLTPVKSDLVNAPFIAEFPFVLECKLVQTICLGLHTQFIGEIMDVKVEESVLSEAGFPDVTKVKPFMVAPGPMEYYAIGGFLGKAFDIGKK